MGFAGPARPPPPSDEEPPSWIGFGWDGPGSRRGGPSSPAPCSSAASTSASCPGAAAYISSTSRVALLFHNGSYFFFLKIPLRPLLLEKCSKVYSLIIFEMPTSFPPCFPGMLKQPYRPDPFLFFMSPSPQMGMQTKNS